MYSDKKGEEIMKRKPILKPKFQGCMNCSKVPETTLKPSDKIKKSSFMTL